MITSLSAQQLRTAADLKERIDSLQKELARILYETTPAKGKTGKKIISHAAKRRIAAAKMARWAKLKKSKPSVPTNNPGTRKSTP